jgi:hypothetical protein
MCTVDARAAQSPGEPLVPTTVERRDSGSRDRARSVIRLLTRLGDIR